MNKGDCLMIRKVFCIKRQLSELYRDHDVYITPLPGINFNDFVRISYTAGKRKKSIYVWVRIIDDYYRTFYNSITDKRFDNPELLINKENHAVVLCRYYRIRLGLDENFLGNVQLELCRNSNPLKKIRALYNAPDSIIRTTTVISVISLMLGIIALVLGVLSIV